MASFTAQWLLLWILLALGEKDTCAYASANDTAPSGLRQCQETLRVPTLEVLPGGGWDNLRNLDMGRVMSVGYSSCRTTEDGAYIIPDDVSVIPQKHTSLVMSSEIVESWKDYKSSTASSINAELSVFSLVAGTFSTDFQSMKTHQVRDQSFSTRVQIRNLRYTVKASPNVMFDPVFKDQLLDIVYYQEKNQASTANYLAEKLFLNYGTHVLTSVDAGACLVQEDHIQSTFLKDNWAQKSSIYASAKAAFQDTISFGIGYNTKPGDSFTNNYLANRISSRAESIGGVPFYPGITLKTWQEGITNQLVAIDRSGLPLHFFINPQTLGDLSEPAVTKLRKTVEAAFNRYYEVNTYPGCTDATSPNFNFQANVDDASCEIMVTNSTFGGTYQDCTPVSGRDSDLLCQRLEQKNTLTGDFSCPEGYAPVKLHSQNKEEGFSRNECHDEYFWKIFWHNVCADVPSVSIARFSAYWCVAQREVPQNSGYLFGGLFSSASINPLTTAQSCPSSYYPLKLFDDLQICVSGDYEMGYRYSVPFGGFFSCDEGNSLALSKTSTPPNNLHGQNSPPAPPKKCPTGFSQHLALINEGCPVNYCVKSAVFTEGALPQILLPPFSHPPIPSVDSTNTVLFLTGTDHSWVKDSNTRMWKSTNTTDASSTSGGGAAGIAVGVTISLIVLVAMAMYGWPRYRSMVYQRLATDEAQCENTELQESTDQFAKKGGPSCHSSNPMHSFLQYLQLSHRKLPPVELWHFFTSTKQKVLNVYREVKSQSL